MGNFFQISSEKPIGFASRTLSPAEKHYSQLDKEALAIIFGIKKFHDYLQGHHFTIYSDHQPLQYLFGVSKPIPPMASGRLKRWALGLRVHHQTQAWQRVGKCRCFEQIATVSLPRNCASTR